MKTPFQYNPFPVEAWFDFSITLTFAVPREELAARLPPCLEPDTFADQWGFLAVAIVQTRDLRPRGLPRFLGSNFILAGYRHFVCYRSADGRRLRGLQIIRSETDRRTMTWLGNIFTPYHYIHASLIVTREHDTYHVNNPKGGLDIQVSDSGGEGSALPPDSPFANWRDARQFCGPMPFTFSVNEFRRRILLIEGVREQWKPRPIRVIHHHIPYLHELGFSQARLACAFIVRDIPYYWKKGRMERLPAS